MSDSEGVGWTTYGGQDEESHEEWKARQSPEGTISDFESLEASRYEISKEGER